MRERRAYRSEERSARAVSAAWRPARRPKKRAVAEAHAAGVVVGREAGGGPADGVETRDAMTSVVERGAVAVGDQTAEGEGGIDRAVVDAQVDGADAARRRHADGLQVGCALVECGVDTAGRGLVVLAHGARQGVGWNVEVGGQLLGGGRGVADSESDEVRLVDHVVGDHVDEAVLVAQGVEADATGVGILVDESLAMAVDEDPAGETVGWSEG